ncbi:MAG TPA: NUDIX domain-containing protein [Chloroflexota bacterium]|jgi:8-oxo-dGTP pyrophosphatase MutT (NUDIX family)|nr:NUDIX domain-containing protein [Chloroflexota bacterium]
MTEIDRHFTVAVFVVSERRVLLHQHVKLGMWLPPGGHIEAGELPDEAAIREVQEETGVDIELQGASGLPIEYPRQLVQPAGIQLEDIAPNHQHIDLIYFASPLEASTIDPIHASSVQAGWYGLDELETLGVNDEVRAWCARAVSAVTSCARP